MEKKFNSKNHIIIISILIILFFSLLFLSTSEKGISQTITFKEEIIIDSLYNNNFEIGNLIISNTDIFPKKILFDEYIVCQISKDTETRTYRTNYIGSKSNTNYLNPFSYYSNSIDISSNDKVDLKIVLDYFNDYQLREDINKYDLNNKTIKFYIFKVQNNNEYGYYNFCDTKVIEEADFIINIKFEIKKEDLENVKLY